MWISGRKWKAMEQRVADLEKKVQSQPDEIISEIAKQLYRQMTKTNVVSPKMGRNQFGQKAIDCATQHIHIFFEQATEKRTADYGEPCEKCSYKNKCNYDWLTIMHPLLEKSNIKVSMVRPEKTNIRDSVHMGHDPGKSIH